MTSAQRLRVATLPTGRQVDEMEKKVTNSDCRVAIDKVKIRNYELGIKKY